MRDRTAEHPPWSGNIAAVWVVKIMKDLKNMLRIVGILLLGMFVLVVGIPLILAAAGIVLSGIGAIVGIAVMLIKLGVVVAVGYLILVGIRAVLR
jgi:hypothetical protein